jgi:hypothetical protein
MKTEKARLADLAGKMKKPEIRKTDFGKAWSPDLDGANRPHGERGDFRKVTVMLPPDAYRLLVEESARRKIAGESNHLLTAIIREAVVAHLGKGAAR